MIKRTLIAIAVVALLATSAHAVLDTHLFPIGNDHAVKVDGKQDNPDNPLWNRWPYTISYSTLKVCNIPIKMHVGMFVQVKDCKNKKIFLEQVDCGDIQKGAGDYPCYFGDVEFEVRSNFNVKLGTHLNKTDIMPNASAYYEGGDTVPGDGDWHNIKVCVKAWKAAIYKATPGDAVDAGSLDITVKPNF